MTVIQTDIHKPIIEKALQGNRKAQHQLYNMYSKAMLNICFRMMNNLPEAEDMLQESFIEAFRRLDSFRFESTFGAWLKRICINKCINELKRKKVVLEYNDQWQQIERVEPVTTNTEDIDFSVEKIKHAMALLPDGYRVVFSLYLLEGYDHEEIAGILNISESTSKTQLMRAKKKVAEIIKAGQIDFISNN
ncbi:MAG: sigma-70 family RNA polymerase sigma factor [Marinilabiliaceae bacterium]|nr:sigma-70 family RNA polymerase sigma factor [Marinilabiliaceae bacterium]